MVTQERFYSLEDLRAVERLPVKDVFPPQP
jgi:hypothetical protein